jgi:hypothetical protein
MRSENDGEQEDVLNETADGMSTPTRRRSQRVEEAIRTRNNQDTKVIEYKEFDTSLFKYLGNNI